MNNLRRWRIEADMPFSLPLAADARLSPTDYQDDQVWELRLGSAEAPALALQTRYGGRVGLASLIPLWSHDGRTIYETQAYAMPPLITGFAPGYLRVQAALNSQLALQAEYWVIDSHTIGGRFTLANAHTNPTSVQLDLFGHVGAEGKEQPLSIIPLQKNMHALQMGKIANINPVVMLEGGAADLVDDTPVSPKLGVKLEIGSRKKIVVRWVHAGLPTVRDSLAQAQLWLEQNWDHFFKQIDYAAQFIPRIETDDEMLDLALASAYQQLALSFLRPTTSLPHASIVGLRKPYTGFSRQRDGSHPWREWSGQSPINAYLAGLALASIDPSLAQGLVRNYLAVQQPDGAIDWKPGLGGQRQGVLCLPVLARLAWGIFQYTEDDQFIKEVFPGLLKFFNRWLAEDSDHDGLPQWQSENQTGYVFMPSFALGQAWGQNLDIRTVETPDLLAYLLSEAISLQAIAHYLHDSGAEQTLLQQIKALQNGLETLWNGERYTYRDRDTHQTTPGNQLLREGRGDEEHILALPLSPASRIIVRIEGGVDHTPRFTLRIEGLGMDGQALAEIVDAKAFLWQHRRGAYTTQRVFSQVDRVRCEGLSRVYHLSLYTPDLTRLDINTLLPLWSVVLPSEHAEALKNLLINPDHFWRPNGVSMCSAQDAHFDPANANGSGGVWPFWLTLIGEGLIETGHPDIAAELLRRLLPVQISVLRQQHDFAEFYHSEQPVGLGEKGQLAGVAPLHLFLRVIGVRIIHAGKVWTGGAHPWDTPITIRQHGVTVNRSTERTTIQFASGHQVTLPSGAAWQAVTDPNTQPLKPPQPHKPKSISRKSKSSSGKPRDTLE